MDWQPIETAPKDKSILVSMKCKTFEGRYFRGTALAKWIDRCEWEEWDEWLADGEEYEPAFYEYYSSYETAGGGLGQLRGAPTHWMRLPLFDDPDWQPIETAPKDEYIFLWIEHAGSHEVVKASWYSRKIGEDWESWNTGAEITEHELDTLFDRFWEEYDDDSQIDGSLIFEETPTHWMPLPEPPKKEVKKKEYIPEVSE